MTDNRKCPHCGAPLREERLGVRMTPLKARLFDAVKRGCPSSSLREISACYRSHVWQIKDMIEGAGWTIQCGKGNRYFKLVRSNL